MASEKKEENCIENCDLFKDRIYFIQKLAFKQNYPINFFKK